MSDYIRLTVDGIVLNKKNEVLLLKRKKYPFIGYWVLPGGHVEYGETVEKAVIREVWEETGLRAKIVRLLGVYSDPKRDPRYHTTSPAFVLKIAGGKLKGNYESSELKFFGLNKIPKKMGFDHGKILKDFIKLSRK